MDLGRLIREQVRRALDDPSAGGVNVAAASNVDGSGHTTSVHSDGHVTVIRRDGETQVIHHGEEEEASNGSKG